MGGNFAAGYCITAVWGLPSLSKPAVPFGSRGSDRDSLCPSLKVRMTLSEMSHVPDWSPPTVVNVPSLANSRMLNTDCEVIFHGAETSSPELLSSTARRVPPSPVLPSVPFAPSGSGRISWRPSGWVRTMVSRPIFQMPDSSRSVWGGKGAVFPENAHEGSAFLKGDVPRARGQQGGGVALGVVPGCLGAGEG